jgi:hypothetical protein
MGGGARARPREGREPSSPDHGLASTSPGRLAPPRPLFSPELPVQCQEALVQPFMARLDSLARSGLASTSPGRLARAGSGPDEAPGWLIGAFPPAREIGPVLRHHRNETVHRTLTRPATYPYLHRVTRELLASTHRSASACCGDRRIPVACGRHALSFRRQCLMAWTHWAHRPA